jgi:phosphoglycolate phosphatase-like HAD superfamily hydrolase
VTTPLAFRGAIFDVDGVLVDPPHAQGWQETLRELMAGEWQHIRAQTSYAPERYTPAVYQQLQAGKPRLAGAQAALEYFGLPDADRLAKRHATAKQEHVVRLIEEGQFTAFPDALRFILAVKGAGIPVAAAPSSQNAKLFLRQIRLDTFTAEQRLDYPFVTAGMTLLDLFDADTKQADVLMVQYLLPGDELQDLLSGLGYHVTRQQLAQTVDYYLARTVDGSTLSGVVTSWVLARQNPAEAWRHLLAALNSDVADIQGGTTAEGIHLGAMAGTVDIVLRGLTGMLARGDTLRFDPALPEQVRQLRFSVHYRGNRLDIRLVCDRMSVTCRPGREAPVTVTVREQTRQVTPGETAEFQL